VIAMAKDNVNVAAKKPVFKGHLDKLKTLFFHPKEFFDKVAAEQKYMAPVYYLVVVMVISYIIHLFFQLPSFSSKGVAVLIFAIMFYLIGVMFAVGISFAIPFVNAGIIHLGVLVYGGRKGYYNTFKPTGYALIVGSIYGILSLLITDILAIVQPIKPEVPATITLASIIGMIPTSYLITFAVISVISLIHVIVTEATGISKYHEIPKWRAVLASITPRIIMTLISIIFLVLMFKFIGALMAASPGPV
jgi:hypothetical protein